MWNRSTVGLVVILVVPAGLQSQRLASIPSYASSLPAPTSSFHVDSTQAIPRTYWLEGGVIGGLTLGVLTVLEFHAWSESEPSTGRTVGVFFLAGGLGFSVGALIGGQFPKHDE